MKWMLTMILETPMSHQNKKSQKKERLGERLGKRLGKIHLNNTGSRMHSLDESQFELLKGLSTGCLVWVTVY
jgi:hypothetical protein